MNWTREQRETIETTGKNILVSAAAGSGKTTVLVERIKNLVINEGADIDRFLITTFTKAAASEMRERLEKAVRNELKKPDVDREYLNKQLQLLPTASIGTFHSFAIEVIRQYFYLTDLEPGFDVGDEIQMAMMRRDAINRVFERRYEEEYEIFSRFLLKYSSDKGDDRLKSNMLSTYRTLVSIPDYITWAKEKADMLNAEDPVGEFRGYSAAGEMILDALEEAVDKYSEAAEEADLANAPSVFKNAKEDAAVIAGVLNSARTAFRGSEDDIHEEIKRTVYEIMDIKLNSMPYKADKADDETRDRISKLRNAGKKKTDYIKKNFTEEKFEIYRKDISEIYEDTLYYIDLIEEFTSTFRQIKASENLIDFDDIMHYAIEILKYDEASSELREKYEYIFVDEYQDSNNLQEAIISRISRENNLFMVGDVKQCIYKFRLAEPELFNAKAREYKRMEETESMLLHLNSNFRSKSSVTESVNAVFEKVMHGYDDSVRLNCTAPAEYSGFDPRLHMVIRADFAEDAPGKTDAEAALAAKIIREKLGQEIYDGKLGCVRRLTFRDFAIIARKNHVVEDMERYLNNEGIPAYGEGSGKYFETVEVQVFINLLRIIENMSQDIPLISAMRSVVFGFGTDELAKIRIGHRNGSFYSAVMDYAVNGNDQNVKEKIKEMVSRINLWKEISRTVPLEELIKKILYETGYYDYCSGLPVGIQRVSNLRLIAEKANRYEQISHGGLYGFLKYIEAMESSGQTDSEAKVAGENEDVVRIMTVHKSKGLEFPVVIFPDASRQTKSPSMSEAITVHADYGIGLPRVNREEHWHRRTFLQKAISYRKEKEVIEEEIRILYVALTRAKDGLEIISSFRKEDEIPSKVNTGRFIDMMYVPLKDRDGTEEIIYADPAELEQQHLTRMHSVEELFGEMERVKTSPDNENAGIVSRRLDYRYPYEVTRVNSKYSVSQLNAGGKEQKIPVADFNVKREDIALTPAKAGTLMHLLMEKADFKEAAEGGEAYMQSVADRLLADETITPSEYDAINVQAAAAFFSTETGIRAADAAGTGKLQKEKEFILEKEIDGEQTIIQGIIDCFFEEEGNIILIDYKNSSLESGRTGEEIAERYAEQLSLYAEALEKGTRMPVTEAYLYLFSTGTFIKI